MDLSNKIKNLPKYIKHYFTRNQIVKLSKDVPYVFIIVYGENALIEYLLTLLSEEDDYEQYEISYT
ncbi:MAG: hypothetical protein R3321_01635 [Nitrososphaeraceae archaeon]|nr:hypothetical protein [Nitrososphaeraceae archaeon]